MGLTCPQEEVEEARSHLNSADETGPSFSIAGKDKVSCLAWVLYSKLVQNCSQAIRAIPGPLDFYRHTSTALYCFQKTPHQTECTFTTIKFNDNKVTPILRVMVCPSLKPRSSLGVVSGACACFLNSVSCFTHLEKTRWGHEDAKGLKINTFTTELVDS